jgi:hypothetical protein
LFLVRDELRGFIADLRKEMGPFELILLIALGFLAVRAFMTKDP